MSMPKGERVIFAHIAADIFDYVAARTSNHASEGLGEIVDLILAEFGVRLDFAELAGERPARDIIAAAASLIRHHVPGRRVHGLDARLAWLVGIVDGSELDLKILSLLARTRLYTPYEHICGFFMGRPASSGEMHLDTLAALCRVSHHSVRSRLEPGSPLLDAGLVSDCRGGEWSTGDFAQRVALMRSTKPETLARNLLGRAPAPTLEWQDFVHLEELGDLARKLVAASASRGVGSNILLYGVPGTGKSEFARVLAQQCDLHPVWVGVADENGQEPNRSERLAHLAVARSLVRHSRRHLLIVDEAEDIMVHHNANFDRGSKFYLNNMVDKTTCPTIWIVNDPQALGSPIVRRMTLAIRFDLPGRRTRQRIAERIAREERLKLAPSELTTIAEIDASPAVARNAIRAAAWTSGEARTAVLAAQSVQSALTGRCAIKAPANALFDPRLSCASTDLDDLVERLTRSPSNAWSILAFGPPGTGKSALARHLADRLGREVVEKRGSDLLSKWVGGTEKRIAEAFRQAADRRALLIIDEADSLLRDRQLAQQSWEATMTNEMLTWMEAAQTPFFATTNLKRTLDPATARRFSLSIEFFPLTAEQTNILYNRYFGVPAPAELARIPDLTPGDFAQIASRFEILGGWSNGKAIEALAAAAAERVGAAPIGFR
jgi:SpoVK/Ycf46/Vps4 family AAA+-type ATPase